MQTVNQPTPRPTNKYLAYTAGGVIGIVALYVIRGDWSGAASDPIVVAGIPLLCGAALAYFVKDAPNVRP